MGHKLLTERVNSARTRSLGLWQEGLRWLSRSLRAQERRDHPNTAGAGPRQAETFWVLSLFWVSIWWGKCAILAVTKQVESVCGANVIILSYFRLCRVSLVSSVSLQSGYHRTPWCWGGRELGTVQNSKVLLAIQNTVYGHLLFKILLWGLRTQSASQTVFYLWQRKAKKQRNKQTGEAWFREILWRWAKVVY